MNRIETLIIEDDPMLARILQRFIYKVPDFSVLRVCHNYADSIDALSLNPHLILLDIYLNSNTSSTKNGLDILKEIRKRNMDTDIIMITASKDIGVFSQCLRLGVIDFIIKPFEFTRLEETLQNYTAIRNGITEGHNLITQNDIDSITQNKNMPKSDNKPALSCNNLPKNIDMLTLEKIYACIAQEKSYTAAQISDLASLSYATVKKYLDYLCENNTLNKSLQYSKVGRPLTVYTLI